MQHTQCGRVALGAVTPVFGVIFMAFPVFLARLAGEKPSAGAGKMKTRETFTAGLRHPKKVICVVIWSLEVCLVTGSSKGAFIWEPKALGREGLWILRGEVEVAQPRNCPGVAPALSLPSARVLEQPGRREIQADPARCPGRGTGIAGVCKECKRGLNLHQL